MKRLSAALFPFLALLLCIPASAPAQATTPNLAAPPYTAAQNPYAHAGGWGSSAWYVWGRVYEVTGIPLPAATMEWTYPVRPEERIPLTFCDQPLYWWYDNIELANRGTGYPYSNHTPQVHGVVVFAGRNDNPPGHLAFIERIEDDRIYFTHAGSGGLPAYSGEDSIAIGQQQYGAYTLVGFIHTAQALSTGDALGLLDARILQVDIPSPTSAPGETARLHITTTDSVRHVILTDAGGHPLAESDTPTATDPNGALTWDLPWQTASESPHLPPAHPQSATIHAYGSHRADTRIVTLDFHKASFPEAPPPAIVSVETQGTPHQSGAEGRFTITTNSHAQSVALINEFGRALSTSDQPTTDPDGGLTWTLHWQPDQPGTRRLQIHATGADGALAVHRLAVEVALPPSQNEDVLYLDVAVSPDSVELGKDLYWLYITTSDDVAYIRLLDGAGNPLYTALPAEGFGSDENTLRWVIDMPPPTTPRPSFTVQAVRDRELATQTVQVSTWEPPVTLEWVQYGIASQDNPQYRGFVFTLTNNSSRYIRSVTIHYTVYDRYGDLYRNAQHTFSTFYDPATEFWDKVRGAYTADLPPTDILPPGETLDCGLAVSDGMTRDQHPFDTMVFEVEDVQYSNYTGP